MEQIIIGTLAGAVVGLIGFIGLLLFNSQAAQGGRQINQGEGMAALTQRVDATERRVSEQDKIIEGVRSHSSEILSSLSQLSERVDGIRREIQHLTDPRYGVQQSNGLPTEVLQAMANALIGINARLKPVGG